MGSAATDALSHDLPNQQARTLADRIIAQADAGQFPRPAQVVSKLQSGDFALDGLNFKFRQVQEAGQMVLRCSALCGYLPYTIEQPGCRLALRQIMQASERLRHARFSLGNRNMIRLEGAVPLPAACADEDLMLALLHFVQEARPFLLLVAAQFKS